MTRSPHVTLIDPIDAIRYVEDRTIAQAADFLQLLGWPISAGALEDRNDEGKLGSSAKRTGKVSEGELLKLIKKNPSWLSSLPHFDVDEGMLTTRMAMEVYKSAPLDYFLKGLAAGCNYKLRKDGPKRTIVVHESWLRQASGDSRNGGLGYGKKEPIAPPAKPVVPRHDPGVHSAEPVAPRKVPPKPEAPKKAEPKAATEKPTCLVQKACYPIPAMAQLLQDVGFGGATEGKIYYYIAKGEIKVVASKPRKLVAEEEIDHLIDSDAGWLKREPSRHFPPEGILTGIMMAEKYELKTTRTYQVINAGLVEATSMTPDDAERNIWYITVEAAQAAVDHPVLGAYLRGAKMAFDDLLAQLGSGFVARPHAPHQEAEPSDTPDDIVVIEADRPEATEPPVAPVSSDDLPDITIGDVLTLVHEARQIVHLYEMGIQAGWDEDTFLNALGHFIP
jgi:hypothetical protein